MNSDLDISVLMTTYNRAEILRETLNCFVQLDRVGIRVEFVIIDNNSSDETAEVIESFRDKLSLRYLFEPRPGKNIALNKALREVKLGKLVIFTDDDVRPSSDWLKAIKSISSRWTDYSVFGGKVELVWPEGQIPIWISNEYLQVMAYSQHDYADAELPYAKDSYPFGINFWVRREVFAKGLCFQEMIGPRPDGFFIMGSELSFLRELSEHGYQILYSPQAVVGHQVQPEQLAFSYLRRRALRHGRSMVYFQPLWQTELYQKHPLCWHILWAGAFLRNTLQLGIYYLAFSSNQRMEKIIRKIVALGYLMESLTRVRKQIPDEKSTTYELAATTVQKSHITN